MPLTSFGTWALEEAGDRHIDCAGAYGNQAEIRAALRSIFARGKVKHQDVWITSKIWNDHYAPGDAERCCRRPWRNCSSTPT